MARLKKHAVLKITACVTFAAAVMNALAVYTAPWQLRPSSIFQVFPSLIMPAEQTFAIGGIIFQLLTFYTAWQLFSKNAPEALTNRINIWFSVSTVACAAATVSWEMRLVPPAVFFMVAALVSLVVLVRFLDARILSAQETLLIKLPFYVYFGWMTFMTILSVTLLLVYFGADSFGPLAERLAIVTLTAGTILGMWTGIRFKTAVFLLVFIWAYAGILYRHVSADGFNWQFPRIAYASIACLLLLTAALAVELTGKLRKRKGI